MGLIVNPFGSFGGAGAGPGDINGRPLVVQDSGKFSAANFTGAQTFHFGSNFAGGNDVLVCTNHWHTSAIGIASVVVGGVNAGAAVHTGVGSTALLQYWIARNVPSGSNTVVITPTSGTGHYMTAHAIECSPFDTTALDVFAESNTTSATPGSTVTTAITTACEELVYACWRDDSGVTNAAPVTPSGYTLGALETDGVGTQGGAMAYKRVQRFGTQNATFGCTSTLWYETTAAFKFKPPCVIASITKQDWNADTNWNPTTIAVTPVTGEVLVSVSGAWNDSGNRPWTLPTDSNGTFVAASNPTISGPEDPVNIQICYEATPSTSAHTVTPPTLANGGDGYFALLRIPGLDTASPIRDSGRFRSWHAQHAPPDPATIQTATITTTGSAAQVGDLALLALVIDPSTVTNADAVFVPPAGWFVLINKFNMTDNIGFIVCAAKVSVAGQISATITWTDNATFVADGTIIIFSHL